MGNWKMQHLRKSDVQQSEHAAAKHHENRMFYIE
jgi:hypothetical protein